MNTPREFADDYDGKHTYTEEERKLILDEISKRLFDERRFFVLVMFDADKPPAMLVNGGKRSSKFALSWIMERFDYYFSSEGETVFAEYRRRQ